MSAEPIRFARLVVDPDGVSRFEDAEVAVTPRDFAPPAAPLDVSAAMEATTVIYWRAPPGWDGQRHPAPTRQWAIVLRGALEVEASSGATRRFGPGDGVLLEDVSGDGHITRVVSTEPAVGMFIQVPEESSVG